MPKHASYLTVLDRSFNPALSFCLRLAEPIALVLISVGDHEVIAGIQLVGHTTGSIEHIAGSAAEFRRYQDGIASGF